MTRKQCAIRFSVKKSTHIFSKVDMTRIIPCDILIQNFSYSWLNDAAKFWRPSRIPQNIKCTKIYVTAAIHGDNNRGRNVSLLSLLKIEEKPNLQHHAKYVSVARFGKMIKFVYSIVWQFHWFYHNWHNQSSYFVLYNLMLVTDDRWYVKWTPYGVTRLHWIGTVKGKQRFINISCCLFQSCDYCIKWKHCFLWSSLKEVHSTFQKQISVWFNIHFKCTAC